MPATRKQVINETTKSLLHDNDENRGNERMAAGPPLYGFKLANCQLDLSASQYALRGLARNEEFAGKMTRRQKERALTSPKTSALAFISVLPWRINDGQILLAARLE
jgi:hypothetical protein